MRGCCTCWLNPARMKLLNKQFNENELGYATWREFVEDAKMATNIIFHDSCFVLNTDPAIYILTKSMNSSMIEGWKSKTAGN